MPKQKITGIHAIRYDGLSIDQNVLVRVLHKNGIDLMDAIDACFSAWYYTEAGRKAWSQSCCDYNIGDLLSGAAPDREFTRSFGFEILPDTEENIIEISYDRVLGHSPDEEDSDAELVEEQTLSAEQECDCCGRRFRMLYHEDGTYEYLDDWGDGPCDCEAGFHPVDGSPSISEWMESLKR